MVLAEENKAEFWRVYALVALQGGFAGEADIGFVPSNLNSLIQTRLALDGRLSGSVYLLNDSLFVPSRSRRPT